MSTTPVFRKEFDGANAAVVFADIQAQAAGHNLLVSDIIAGPSGSSTDWAVSMTAGKYLYYSTPSSFNLGKGTIEMMVKPLGWNGWDVTPDEYLYKYLISITCYTGGYIYSVYYDRSPGSKQVFFNSAGVSGEQSLDGPYTFHNWPDGEWRRVIVYWDFTLPASGGNNMSYVQARFADSYIPPRFVAQTSVPSPASGNIYIGTNSSTYNPLLVAVANIRIYDQSMLPCADGSGGFVASGKPFPAPIDNAFYPGTTGLYNPWDADPAAELAKFKELFRTWDPDTLDWVEDGVISPWENYNNNPTDCPTYSGSHSAENAFFFKRPHLEEVFEGFVPVDEDINAALSYKGNPGEKVQLFFNIHANLTALTNCQVQYLAALDGPGVATIPTTNMDMRIVNNWWQAGRDNVNMYSATMWWCTGLLLHEDTDFESDQTLVPNKVPTQSAAPQAAATADLDRYISRQFCLIVDIPADAVAGEYTCTIRLTADEIAAIDKTLTLTVLPFALRDVSTTEPIKLYGGWFENVWDAAWYAYPGAMNLDIWDVLYKQYKLAYDMGCRVARFVSNNDDDPNNWSNGGRDAAWSATSLITADEAAACGLTYPVGTASFLEVQANKLKCAKLAGFTKCVIWAVGNLDEVTALVTTDLITIMEVFGFEAVLYGFDEFAYNVNSTWSGYTLTYQNEITLAKRIHAVGGKVYGNPNADADLASWYANVGSPPTGYWAANVPISGAPYGDPTMDYMQWNYGFNRFYQLISGTATDYGIQEGYAWRARNGANLLQRILSGGWAYITPCDVATPDEFNNLSNTCYNEFNEYHKTGAIYPAVDLSNSFNPLENFTLQCVREGIRDFRFLKTYMYYYNLTVGSHPTEAANSKTTYFDPIIDAITDYFNAKHSPVATPTQTVQETWRTTLIDQILYLQGLQLYSRGAYASLPSDDAYLTTIYSTADLAAVATDDNTTYVSQSASGQYAIHEFKNDATGKSIATVTWDGQSTTAPLSAIVKLQIYNQNTGWEDAPGLNASNNSALANVDFTLTSTISGLDNYKDANGLITCRVYQLEP